MADASIFHNEGRLPCLRFAFFFAPLRFLIDGKRIDPSHSPGGLDLEDLDQIGCMLAEEGN